MSVEETRKKLQAEVKRLARGERYMSAARQNDRPYYRQAIEDRERWSKWAPAHLPLSAARDPREYRQILADRNAND